MIQQISIVPGNNSSKDNNSYKYSIASVLFIPTEGAGSPFRIPGTISLESLNTNLMEFIEFLNDNSIMIFSGTLGLVLFFIYLSSAPNPSNTNHSSNNTFNVNFGEGGAGSSSNAPDNSSNNNKSSS